MLTPIVILYLFALGVLVLFGLWRIERAAARATLQRGLLARRVAHLSRRVLLLNRSMRPWRIERTRVGRSADCEPAPLPAVSPSVREGPSPPRTDPATWS